MARVLGVDPGFASFGYALLDIQRLPVGSGLRIDVVSAGVLRTQKSDKKQKVLAADDNFRRLTEISHSFAQATNIVDIVPSSHHEAGFELAVRPACICAESMSFPRNASASAKVGMTWGMLAAFTALYSVPLLMVSPQQLKKTVCGDRSASKEAVQEAVDKRLSAPLSVLLTEQRIPKGQWEHPYDALAAVLACADSDVMRVLLGAS